MHNLLWKFLALGGVAGVGFMVVLQAMEGMRAKPDFGAPQATASQEPLHPAPQAAPSSGEAIPPLRTKETVALGNLPPSDAYQPAEPGPAATPPASIPFDPNSFPVASQPAKAASPLPSPANGVTQADFPLEFPAPAPPEFQAASATSSPKPELPELPVLIPMNDQTETPKIEAFAEGNTEASPNPFTDPPVLKPQPAKAPTGSDPFSDPLPLPETKPADSGPASIPFDPYEPVSESSQAPAPTPASEPSTPPAATAQQAPAAFPPVIFPPAPEPASNSAKPTEDSGKNSPFGPPSIPAQTETPSDPLDLNPPQAAFPGQTPKTSDSPGRASVNIPLAPPAEPSPLVPPKPYEAPKSTPPEPKSVDSAPAPKPIGETPDQNFPTAEGPETYLPAKRPECAVPAVAFTETPPTAAPDQVPFVDPLDQLTFPSALPAVANVPEPAKPELGPPPGPIVASEENPFEPNNAPNPLPAVPAAPLGPELGASPFPVSPLPEANVAQAQSAAPAELPVLEGSPLSPATSEGIEGVGVLGGSVPSGPQQPELKIEKTAPPKAAINQPMIYNILVRNVGQSAAHEVIVEDQVPRGTKLTGTIPRGEMTEDRLIWRLGVIQPGEEKKIAVRVIPTQEGQIGSVAKVSFVAEVAARTVVAAPKLDLEFTGPASAVVGDPVTYHFKLANIGSGDASKVYLRNILPEGLNHPGGSDLEYEVGTLKAGEVKEIDLTVNATKAGEFTNKAVISATGGLQKEAATKVKIIGDRLTITRTGPKRRYVGRTASFSNTIANQSDAKVAPVHVVEVIPAGMDFVEANLGGKFDPQKRTVTWAIAELGPSENQLLKLELLAREEGPQASEVTAYDPNGTRAAVKSETTVEGYTALRLDVRDYAEPVDVGEQVGLRIVASNRGTQATTKVNLRITIPDEMEFVSAKGPVDFKRDGKTLTFNPVTSLNAQQEIEFDLVLRSLKPGDSRVRLEIDSDQTSKPLAREEGIRILATKP